MQERYRRGWENLHRFHIDPEAQRRRAYKRMSMEKARADMLEKQGWKILSPTVVCDRIGIKDGKVYLIEFKKDGQKLRPNQELVKSLIPMMYQVVTY